MRAGLPLTGHDQRPHHRRPRCPRQRPQPRHPPGRGGDTAPNHGHAGRLQLGASRRGPPAGAGLVERHGRRRPPRRSRSDHHPAGGRGHRSTGLRRSGHPSGPPLGPPAPARALTYEWRLRPLSPTSQPRTPRARGQLTDSVTRPVPRELGCRRGTRGSASGGLPSRRPRSAGSHRRRPRSAS
jgi:hypothetical protein